ncbi:hypothetical protein A9267_20555 [Shewanella sp. UCD-FRSSP16_17]|uniref:hypothetical protein n=1 Tax=Shewanella sp. UCD-FRSSP16_17 TaxID=1853256 RepID=UPI0007EE9788|nr:hypothetical protein [Shewanella sp. UCD-FRSSP16_17]OBT09617.1 hypothetical protein A9267_20555 [Shewanella sp. UCD-FRSSP16_17]
MEDKIVSAVKDFANSINSGGKMVADMSSLIDVTSQLPLSSFDYWERLIRSEFSLALRKSTPPKWKVWSKPSELLTWLDLISWDGYKREKTLRTLSGAAPNTFFFSLAIRRLNDWVPQVREAAREKLPEIAKATNPEFVVEALCIALSNWNSWGRIKEEDKNVLLQIICDEEIAESLRSKLISSTSGPMPSLFSQLGRTPILDENIENIASKAAQPTVRAKAYRSLFEGKISWIEGRKWEWTDIRYCEGRLNPIVAEREVSVQTSLLTLLNLSSEDRSSIVRRISAEILIRDLSNIGVIARDYAEKFASDKSQAVSERGRFALKKLEEIDRANAT